MNLFLDKYQYLSKELLDSFAEKGFSIQYSVSDSSYIIEPSDTRLNQFAANMVAIDQGLVLAGNLVVDFPDFNPKLGTINMGLTGKFVIDPSKVIKSEPLVIREGKEIVKDAIKNDKGKVKMGLLPPLALKRIAEVFTHGSFKYSDWNWQKGFNYSRLYDACQRHLNDWYMGNSKDLETNKSHLAHAACCLMMLIETEELRKDLDDRPKY